MNRQQALNQLRIMQAWHEDFGNGGGDGGDDATLGLRLNAALRADSGFKRAGLNGGQARVGEGHCGLNGGHRPPDKYDGRNGDCGDGDEPAQAMAA